MQADEERLDGELISFVWRSETAGFAVARLRAERGVEAVVVGPISHVTEGQHLALEGRWMQHSQFGRQFKVSRFLVEDPRTMRGLERYLSSGAVRGLGPAFAKRVVETFGLDTLRIISEEPERLLEVSGIGQKRLTEIRAHWERDQQNRELTVMLSGFGIGHGLVARIIEAFGKDSLNIIKNSPYKLAEEVRGIGFRTADAIARDVGIGPDDPARAEAALSYLLGEAEGDGHCFLPCQILLEKAAGLEIQPDPASAALERLVEAGRLIRHPATLPSQQAIYRPPLDRSEARVTGLLRRLLRAQPPPTLHSLAAAENKLKIALNSDQRRAVSSALSHGVTVITGGPGTGKTTIIRVLIEGAKLMGQRWLLAAPTGRAARRMFETTGEEAKTLHRLLEFAVRTNRFTRDIDNPLEADGIVIDEASMVDLQLMDALLCAVRPGCRLVLVGDADQLPSVGPGRVLADLIDSGALPVATLTEVYRQAADSGIVRNAHRINQGAPAISSEREPPSDSAIRPDFYVLERDDPAVALSTLLEVLSTRLPRLGFDPLRDVQVLTPVHAGPLGTEALNERLQDLLNPALPVLFTGFSSARGAEVQRGRRRYRVGDRLIQSRNNYDLEIFNGDVGSLIAVDDGALEADFDGRRVSLAAEHLDDVELAYAISIHKSQGSEYPAVVVVLPRVHGNLLRRNLLYTAITRARRFCCLIGSRAAIELATRRRGGDERFTRLADRLREEDQS